MKIKKLRHSFVYAYRGARSVFHREQNFFIELLAASAVIGAGFFFHITRMEWTAVILSIALVLCCELQNSAIEVMADLLKPRMNDHVGVLKDIMAAMVLIASFGALIVGLIIFLPYCIELFF